MVAGKLPRMKEKMKKYQILFLVALVVCLISACGGKGIAANEAAPVPVAAAAEADSAVCAVCGMKMPKKDMVAFGHKGKKYHVCTTEEKTEFLKNPGKYLKKN